MTIEALPVSGGQPGQEDPHSPHYIVAAGSLPERRLRTLKFGDAFAILDPFGDMPGDADGPEGIYRHDTRLVSEWRLCIAGARPLLLGSAVRSDNAFLTSDLTNPDLLENGAVILAREHLHLQRVCLLAETGYVERLVAHNFGSEPVEILLEYLFATDFADLFEVRGTRRLRRGRTMAPRKLGAGEMRLGYMGLDDVERAVRIGFDPAPQSLDGRSARFAVRLVPGQDTVIHGSIGFAADEPAPTFSATLREAREAARRHLSLLPRIDASAPHLAELLRRSRSDLAMLVTDRAHGPYPYAGIPWFSTVFGRDALITALFSLWLAPAIARGVLRFLAANQATSFDPAADAEPGKILHEMRGGEMAALGEVPFARYYGSIDSTPLFVMLAAAYLERTGDKATIAEIEPAIAAALDWLDRHGDRDGDGFVEYGRLSDKGLLNQGWKDSHDSISHADGSLAEGPIALVEVQAYVYGAWRGGARIALALGDVARAVQLDSRAEKVRERFERNFWSDKLGAYALALDGSKTRCEVLTSNAGHALLTGIAEPARARAVASALLEPRGFSGWGVRTLATGEARYNPMSYHNGSVWPHDNGMLALGLARYGFREEALKILTGVSEAGAHIDQHRLPELFCGFRRRARSGPVQYPVACSPQAWAAATPFALIQACLGIRFAPLAGEIRFVYPSLPPWLDRLEIHDLALGQASVSLTVHRHDSNAVVEVTGRRGDIKVVVES